MISPLVRLLAGVLGSCLGTLAWAAETSPQPVSTGGLFQAVFGLLIVLAMIYGFFWFLRRYGPGQMTGQGVVKVVGGAMLSPRERLVIVEVRDTWLLLGVASGSVNVLHTLDKPSAEELAAVPGVPPFADKLSELLRRSGKS
jgi:flagellar protein FliO/FliZ